MFPLRYVIEAFRYEGALTGGDEEGRKGYKKLGNGHFVVSTVCEGLVGSGALIAADRAFCTPLCVNAMALIGVHMVATATLAWCNVPKNLPTSGKAAGEKPCGWSVAL